jgi:hypothetical protein
MPSVPWGGSRRSVRRKVRGPTRRGSSIDFEKPQTEATELDTELDVEGAGKMSTEERPQKAQKAAESKEAAAARAGRKEDGIAAKATSRTPRRVPEVVRLAPERSPPTRPHTSVSVSSRRFCHACVGMHTVCCAPPAECRTQRAGVASPSAPRLMFADDVGDGHGRRGQPTFKPAEMLEVAERDGEAAMHRTSHAPLVTEVRTPGCFSLSLPTSVTVRRGCYRCSFSSQSNVCKHNPATCGVKSMCAACGASPRPFEPSQLSIYGNAQLVHTHRSPRGRWHAGGTAARSAHRWRRGADTRQALRRRRRAAARHHRRAPVRPHALAVA